MKRHHRRRSMSSPVENQVPDRTRLKSPIRKPSRSLPALFAHSGHLQVNVTPDEPLAASGELRHRMRGLAGRGSTPASIAQGCDTAHQARPDAIPLAVKIRASAAQEPEFFVLLVVHARARARETSGLRGRVGPDRLLLPRLRVQVNEAGPVAPPGRRAGVARSSLPSSHVTGPGLLLPFLNLTASRDI